MEEPLQESVLVLLLLSILTSRNLQVANKRRLKPATTDIGDTLYLIYRVIRVYALTSTLPITSLPSGNISCLSSFKALR